jgi:hypothetical protein
MITRVSTLLKTGAAVICLTLALTGCGGGGNSYNVDHGVFTDGRGNKSIDRTLENQSDFDIDVELSVNAHDYLGTVFVGAHNLSTVTVDHMAIDDYISYHTRFDNGDTTDGTFSEDGRTIFTHNSSRAAGSRAAAQEKNGASFVQKDGPKAHFSIGNTTKK